MTPAEVREWVLKDHRALRALLDALEECAQGVGSGQAQQAGPLRAAAEDFLIRFESHTGWEDRHLRPALLEADAWGEERAALLDEDHREQRELLRYLLEQFRDPERPPGLLASRVLDLVALVRVDMDREEHDLLDPRILRDDVVVIDPEDG